MTGKLTLSMDEAIIKHAKHAAKARGTSVSAMVARLVSGLDEFNSPRGRDYKGPITAAASGLIELNTEASDGQLVEDALWVRYGLDR